MTLLLTVLQTAALMILQHSVLAAEMSGAEAAITNNALSSVLAVFEGAAHFLGRHATAYRRGEFKSRVREYIQRHKGRVCGGGCEMAACMKEA